MTKIVIHPTTMLAGPAKIIHFYFQRTFSDLQEKLNTHCHEYTKSLMQDVFAVCIHGHLHLDGPSVDIASQGPEVRFMDTVDACQLTHLSQHDVEMVL